MGTRSLLGAPILLQAYVLEGGKSGRMPLFVASAGWYECLHTLTAPDTAPACRVTPASGKSPSGIASPNITTPACNNAAAPVNPSARHISSTRAVNDPPSVDAAP